MQIELDRQRIGLWKEQAMNQIKSNNRMTRENTGLTHPVNCDRLDVTHKIING